MYSNLIRLTAIACVATAVGCSSESKSAKPATASEPVAASSVGSPFNDDLTATEAATTIDPSTARTVTQNDLRSDAPLRYTVKRGDTLWGIANMYLKDPWLWPEIWHVNPQVENPHWIFPGDVLALGTGADGQPQVTVEQGGLARLNPRLRTSPVDGPITTIPYAAIAGFLSRPSLLSNEQVKSSAYVVGFRNDHMVGGTNQDVYVRNLDAPVNARFAVVHPAGELRDPETGDVLGIEGVYTATARVLRPGEPLKATLVDIARETLIDDLVIEGSGDIPLTFEVRAPSADVNGQIIAVVDDPTLIGTYQVIAINRGTRHGLAPGNVLAVDQAGRVVRDTSRAADRWFSGPTAFERTIKLPEERAGTALVFRTYDRMSYAITVGAIEPMRVADLVRTP
jgi:hypothetical protein